jgi:hypothetical protein
MRRLLLLAAVALVACSTDFVAPEDERCTIYVGVGEPAEINRWQIDHCESVRVFVVRFDGSVLYSYERSVP